MGDVDDLIAQAQLAATHLILRLVTAAQSGPDLAIRAEALGVETDALETAGPDVRAAVISGLACLLADDLDHQLGPAEARDAVRVELARVILNQ